jgi:hypothetical protein
MDAAGNNTRGSEATGISKAKQAESTSCGESEKKN